MRLPFVYGPRDPLRRLFGVIKRVDDGRKVLLLDRAVAQWRAGRGYVENVAAAIAVSVTSDRAAGRVYNVAEQQVFSELEWTTKVAQAAGFKGEIKVVPSALCPAHLKMPGNLDQHWVPDTSRIRSELNYDELVPLEAALKSSIAWERANPPQQIDPRKLDYAAEDACLASAEAVAS